MKFLILAGGHGSRLWPMSTSQKPKQFQKFINNKTLLQLTFDRHNFTDPSNIYVATNQKYKDLVISQLPTLPIENIIIEPEKKDSGPALCFAMHILREKFGDQETVSISPADHIISDEDEYAEKVTLGHKICSTDNKFAIVEVKAKYPNPNLGYAKIKELYTEIEDTQIYTLDKFIEKPDLETAKEFLKSYKYMWNTGYFIWPLGKFFSELKTHANNLYQTTIALDFDNIAESYNKYEAISIDYALIEKVTPSEILIIPAELDWSDIGTWQTLYEQLANTEKQNLTQGEVRVMDSEDNIIINDSNEKPIVVLGAKNLSIINTSNAILVADKTDSKLLKTFINENQDLK